MSQKIDNKPEVGICIFRRDLRVKHNLALHRATKECKKVIAVYDGSVDSRRALGENQTWWLSKSLGHLKTDLAKLGIKLFFSKTKIDLVGVAKKFKADAVYWNWLYLADYFKSDQQALERLEKQGMVAGACQSSFLCEIDQKKNKSGKPFKVFTPFYRSVITGYKKPTIVSVSKAKVSSLGAKTVAGLGQRPNLKSVSIGSEVEKNWTPGESGASKKLVSFVGKKLSDYSSGRDKLAEMATSRLSAHLHFGEISPDQIIAKVSAKKGAGAKAFVRQLAWRDFCWNIVFNFPEVEKNNYMPVLKGFPWKKNTKLLSAWKAGKTGYPVVDAGMRQLSKTGYMENRARMVVASFLIKDLMMDWRLGEKWFWEKLVDADQANNVIGWQWVAGCGPDPAPFFRIFNPILQAKKFDPDGEYVKTWVPELSKLDKKSILKPWKVPEDKLKAAGIVLGKNYPKPVVDHDLAAKKTLAAYKKIK